VTNLSVKDPFEAFDLYDDRSLMENNLFREVKQNWHFEPPPQKSKEGVWVQVYTVMAMKALTTTFLKWQKEQLKQEAKGKENTWLMYRWGNTTGFFLPMKYLCWQMFRFTILPKSSISPVSKFIPHIQIRLKTAENT